MSVSIAPAPPQPLPPQGVEPKPPTPLHDERVIETLEATFLSSYQRPLPHQMKELFHLLFSKATILSCNLRDTPHSFTVTLEKPVLGIYGSIGKLVIGPHVPITLEAGTFTKGKNEECLSVSFGEGAMRGIFKLGFLKINPVVHRIEFDDTDLCVVTSHLNLRGTLKEWLEWFSTAIEYSAADESTTL